MRLLLDEMIGAVSAEHLRQRGYDVVAVQDRDHAHLRGIDDCALLAYADDARRAVVTDNVPDFYRCHQQRVQQDRRHHGLLLLTNGAFPRHRHDLFVSHLCAALTCELDEHPDDVGSAWIRWLAPAR